MTQIVSSISGIEIYAPSAGNAPTNSSEVSAIASAYQVVSATATQLYAGTAYLTSVNSAQISAARAGNAANASLATSAYYDGTGRLISALPDSAAVSAIASAYQVVTATGSAAVGYGLGAQTAVSSINGSALLPYGFSAISGNSGNWNSTRTAVTANSANWNSVYDTVNSSSASWGGGGGSVVSPSGTILVNGGNIEGTNSAVLTASGEGFESVFFPQNTHLGPQVTGLTDGSVPGTGATLIMPMEQSAYTDFQIILSGNGENGLASASGTIPMGTLTASVPLEDITGAISASANQWFNLSAGVPLTARKDGGILVTGVGELAWNSALTGVSATVANNSASWGQGGVSPATVSSIASSYAESAASGVTDTVSSNSATWGQGGLVTSTASAAASAYTSTSTSVSSFTGVSSVNGSALLARTILPDAQQASGKAHFHFMPTATPWGSTEYTGVLSPLQYATGAALAMKQTNNYGAYYKGNEWFISDVGTVDTAANGVVRAELHRIRGIHLYGSSLNSATGFHLNGSGVDGKSGESAWWYGPTEYNMLTSVNDTVSSNSASWGQGGVDSATVSSIASSYAQDVSAAVSGTVDTVSSQSANWGGSALALSAGPGVKLEKVGDTLVVGADETVLWSNTAGIQLSAGVTANFSESTTHFDRTLWYFGSLSNEGGWSVVSQFPGDAKRAELVRWSYDGASYIIQDGQALSTTDNTTYSTTRDLRRMQFNSNGSFTQSTTTTTFKLFKVVGVNRTAGV